MLSIRKNELKKYISGSEFSKNSDYIFANTLGNDPKKGQENFFCSKNLKGVVDGDLVFCKTDYLPQLKVELDRTGIKINLVTHESDYPINKNLFDYFNSDFILSWWGINVEVIENKVKPIPLGLANSYCGVTLKHNDMENIIKSKPKKLVYLNNNVANYPLVREKLYNIFFSSDTWTVRRPSSMTSKHEYCQELLNHKFCVCPRGNGIDTHRMWECLYLGVIPIVEKNYNMNHFDELPILFVDSFLDIKGEEDYLEKIYDNFSSIEWNWNKLTTDWWVQRMKNN